MTRRASSNHITKILYELMNRSIGRAESAGPPEEVSKEAVSTMIFSVALVEAFLNLFLRIAIDDPKYGLHRETIIKGLDGPHFATLTKKVKAPKSYLGSH